MSVKTWALISITIGLLATGFGVDYKSGALFMGGIGVFMSGVLCVINETMKE